MNMAKTTVAFGMVLIALGVGAMLWFGARTALIPAYFGLPLVICGWLARSDWLRKHAMHTAAVIALLGTVLPGIMVVGVLVKLAWGAEIVRPVAFGVQTAMMVICGLLLVLCVSSFVAVRRIRKTKTT